MDPTSTNQRLDRFKFLIHSLAAFGLVTLVFVGWWMYLRPLQAQQRLGEQRMHQLTTRLATADRTRAEQASLLKQLSSARQREASLLARVPDDPSEEEFLAIASSVANETGLTIKDYRPGKTTIGPCCSSLEVQLIGEGSYESVCRFLDGVARLPRHSSVAGLHIDATGNRDNYLVEIAILLYFGATVEPVGPSEETPHA